MFHLSEAALRSLPRAKPELRRDLRTPFCVEVMEAILTRREEWARPFQEAMRRHEATTFTIRGPRADLVLDKRTPLVVGILNVTPDSFSDGGLHEAPARAVERALEMVAEGVPWIDLGGESTRPGAASISAEEELERILPVLVGIRERSGVWVSIDTTKATVAAAALDAGADMINDVSAGRLDEALLPLLAERAVPCVLNHMRGTPRTMQSAPHYASAIEEVHDELREILDRAVAAGVALERIVLDPGIGFGKRLDDNLELLRHVDELHDLGRPLMVGASRKRFLGHLLDRQIPADRDAGTAAVTAFLASRGVCAHRVHATRETLDLLAVTRALNGDGRASLGE